MTAGRRPDDSVNPLPEAYLLLAASAGVGAVTWGLHLCWDRVIATSQPHPLALGASVMLLAIGVLWGVPHGVALRSCRRRRAHRGLGRVGWGGTPPTVLAAVAPGAAVLVLLALLKWPGLPAVVWLVPVGFLAVEAVAVFVRELDERRSGTA